MENPRSEFLYKVVLATDENPAVIISDSILHPSETNKTQLMRHANSCFLIAANNRCDSLDIENKGRWMISVPSQRVDAIWNKIKKLTSDRAGLLWKSTVSVEDISDERKSAENKHQISFYSANSFNHQEVAALYDYLVQETLVDPAINIKYYGDSQALTGLGGPDSYLYSSADIARLRKPYEKYDELTMLWNKKTSLPEKLNAIFSPLATRWARFSSGHWKTRGGSFVTTILDFYPAHCGRNVKDKEIAAKLIHHMSVQLRKIDEEQPGASESRRGDQPRVDGETALRIMYARAFLVKDLAEICLAENLEVSFMRNTISSSHS